MAIEIRVVIPEWAEAGGSPRVQLSNADHNVGEAWNWVEKRWSSGEPSETYQTAAYRPRMKRSSSFIHRSVFFIREDVLPLNLDEPGDWKATVFASSGSPELPQPETNLRLLHPLRVAGNQPSEGILA